MNWISVKERKPSTKKAILVWHASCKSAHEVFYDCDEWSHVDYCDGDDRIAPTGIDFEFEYWMPLPGEPKDDE